MLKIFQVKSLVWTSIGLADFHNWDKLTLLQNIPGENLQTCKRITASDQP